MSFPVKHLRMPFDIKTKKKETPNSFKGITKTLKLQGQSHLPPLEEKSGINKISTVKEISCDNSRNRFFFDKKTRSTSPPKENSILSENSEEKKTNITNFDKIILVEK